MLTNAKSIHLETKRESAVVVYSRVMGRTAGQEQPQSMKSGCPSTIANASLRTFTNLDGRCAP